MITRKPITPRMVGAGGKALWDDNREIEGRMLWEEAPKFALEQFERKANLVLEAVLPQDAAWLRKFAAHCLRTADIIDGLPEEITVFLASADERSEDILR